MAYDKAKVTIDLEEYQHLQVKISEIENSDYGKLLLAHKTVIAGVCQNQSMNGYDVNSVDSMRRALLYQGFEFNIVRNPNEYLLEASHIYIEKIEKK